MRTSKLYKKATTFLSYQKQESIVAELERKFYDTIFIYGTSQRDSEELTLRVTALEEELRYTLTNYCFEDDLLEYLFNLSHFMTHYLTYSQETQQEDGALISPNSRKSIVSNYA